MKVVLANGMELEPIRVIGTKNYVQGANRDVLQFIFLENVSLDEMESIFTEENCESITIFDGKEEAIHKGYTIRAELKKAMIKSEQETSTTEVQTVKRVIVSMAQRTYAETKLAQVVDEVTNTQLALVELYEGVM